MKRVLLTGASGFIGSHFLEAILKTTDWTVVGLDRIDETSTLHRILETDAYQRHGHRFRFVWHDLRAPINESVADEIGEVDLVLHLAASTHVDRSISNPSAFVLDNVLGTCHLLDWARKYLVDGGRFMNFGTDEVFGSAADGVAFTEDSRTRCGNPYSATKQAAVELATAYHNTYNVQAISTSCMNVLGQRQHREKVVPLFTRMILRGEQVTIHADPTRTKPARRGYIHARNVWNVIRFLIENGTPGERYNIVGDREVDCLELAQMIAAILDRQLKYVLVDEHSSRPGHDLAYRLDGSKVASMGFKQQVTFEASLAQTVKWYAANPKWLGL